MKKPRRAVLVDVRLPGQDFSSDVLLDELELLLGNLGVTNEAAIQRVRSRPRLIRRKREAKELRASVAPGGLSAGLHHPVSPARRAPLRTTGTEVWIALPSS